MIEKRPSLLINCSNSHIGGAVAVSSSFIYCMSLKEDIGVDVSVLASSAIHSNLVALGVDFSRFRSFTVVNFFGIKAFWQGLDRYFIGHDIVFTVFGPSYFLRKRTWHICGFAQPYIIYPEIIEQGMGFIARLKLRMKCKFMELVFSRVDEIVVELDHVRVALLKKPIFEYTPIHIVNSSVDQIFKEPARWSPIAIPAIPNTLRLGIISRNYPHKNLICLPQLKSRLKDLFSMEVEFFVTFSDNEWSLCSDEYRESINNIGSLTLAHCPSFYQAMDGVIFPSLLECFSAVPIESMMMKRPVFASNLPFIVDCCHEHVNYFDPHDIDSMAKCIKNFFSTEKSCQEEFVESAYHFVQTYPDANSRADSYIQIILNSINSLRKF